MSLPTNTGNSIVGWFLNSKGTVSCRPVATSMPTVPRLDISVQRTEWALMAMANSSSKAKTSLTLVVPSVSTSINTVDGPSIWLTILMATLKFCATLVMACWMVEVDCSMFD